MVVAADAFFFTYLAMTALSLPYLDADYLSAHAAGSDEPVWAIFLVTLGAVVVAVVSLFLMINDTRWSAPLQAVLALAAVPLGWFAIHMMAAIHYAHEYWQPEDGEKGGKRGAAPRGGLEFPATPRPRGSDFVYFAYVVGMTAQTSDVAITRQSMRTFNLAHAVVSFFFNTVLVAAAVNLAVSLGS
ncbi:MAG: DUF1345 domain-containing protein [Rhizobiaceae bacterium]|nr:DUF1345 domain-containing protein [Rhizobiaceae bacterium]